MPARISRRVCVASSLTALALAVPASATAQGPSPNASCDGILSSLVAHEQARDDVSYFVHLGAEMGVRKNSGEFFSYFAHQHAGGPAQCNTLAPN